MHEVLNCYSIHFARKHCSTLFIWCACTSHRISQPLYMAPWVKLYSICFLAWSTEVNRFAYSYSWWNLDKYFVYENRIIKKDTITIYQLFIFFFFFWCERQMSKNKPTACFVLYDSFNKSTIVIFFIIYSHIMVF